jgi:hypothetical protein
MTGQFLIKIPVLAFPWKMKSPMRFDAMIGIFPSEEILLNQ